MANVVVAGVGMTPFTKVSSNVSYITNGTTAARAALADAGIRYDAIDAVYASYVLGDTCSGQAVAYSLGLTGAPVFNVNNACASGSSALYLARQAILSGEIDTALVVGFEQMGPRLERAFPEHDLPVQWIDDRTRELIGPDADITTVGWFAAAAREYLTQTGYGPEVLAEVAAKARRHANRNPNAAFRDLLSAEEIMASKTIVSPLTKFECSAPTNGAAAVVLARSDTARAKGLSCDVSIIAQVARSDMPSAQQDPSMMKVVGYDMARETARRLYEMTGLGPADVQLVELHDCFASNELTTYEAIGLCAPGGGGQLAMDGDNTYGGKWVINPSGGLIGKGHPIGATGVAQCVELTEQLRGSAGARQVEGATMALQHNLGLGGQCIMGLYART